MTNSHVRHSRRPETSMKQIFKQLLIYLGFLMALAIAASLAPQRFLSNDSQLIKLFVMMPTGFVCAAWLAVIYKMVKIDTLKLTFISIFWAIVPMNIYLSDIKERNSLESFALFAAYAVYLAIYLRLSNRIKSTFWIIVAILVEIIPLESSFFGESKRNPIISVSIATAITIAILVGLHLHERRTPAKASEPITPEK